MGRPSLTLHKHTPPLRVCRPTPPHLPPFTSLCPHAATASTLSTPSFVGVALKTSREVTVTGKSELALSSGGTAQSVAALAALVPIGFDTLAPRMRARRRA